MILLILVGLPSIIILAVFIFGLGPLADWMCNNGYNNLDQRGKKRKFK